MSPPLRGYTDEQRVENYDTNELYNVTVTNQVAFPASPVLDVSRFAYIAGTLQNTQAASYIELGWWLDEGETIFAGGRQFALHANITAYAQVRIPNLGPFLNINQVPIQGAAYSSTAVWYASNRVYPIEFTPLTPMLMSVQNFALGASQTVSFYPTTYYAGPTQFGMFCTEAAGLAFQTFSTNGTWDYFNQGVSVPTNIWYNQLVTTPPGAWRVTVNNTTINAAQLYVVMTPSLTGAI